MLCRQYEILIMQYMNNGNIISEVTCLKPAFSVHLFSNYATWMHFRNFGSGKKRATSNYPISFNFKLMLFVGSGFIHT